VDAVSVRQPRALVLASASPRRKDILSQLGLRFRVEPSGVDEPAADGRDPSAYALALASGKAEAVAKRLDGDEVVLGADTIVVVDADVLGKPLDDDDARRMLRSLADREHAVITAVALRGVSVSASVAVRTGVVFRALDDATIDGYVATGEGRDKAGGYAVQGMGAGLVREVRGSYSNVVGLPAVETLELLTLAGAGERWP
jgi:septum formation protein